MLQQSASACSELIDFQPEFLQQAELEIAERNLTTSFGGVGFELAVFKAATSEDDREIGIGVRVGIGHPASKENHGVVQQRAFAILY